MDLTHLEPPGRRERHWRRRHTNPLFGDPAPVLTARERDQARQQDWEELASFRGQFESLVQETTRLRPSETSDRILTIKERLDQCYEQVCGLGGNQSQFKEAIGRLVELVMQSVRRGAAGDPQALAMLDTEHNARKLHYQLLEHPIVADLLAPDSPIGPAELTPSLLCCSEQELAAALHLFDADQLELLVQEGGQLLSGLESAGTKLPDAQQRLTQLQQRLKLLDPAPAFH